MTTSDHDSLAHVLLRNLRGDAVDRDADPKDATSMFSAIRAALAATDLSPAEEAIVRSKEADQGHADTLLSALMAARIERAIDAALAVRANDDPVAATGRPVVAHDLGVVSRTSDARSGIPTTLVISGSRHAGADPGTPTVVLTDEASIQRMLRRPARGAVAHSTATDAQRPPDDRAGLLATLPIGTPMPEATTPLEPVEATLRGILALLDTRSSKAVRQAESLVGTVLSDKYQLLNLLGVGGFGAVYRGRDLVLGNEVAIKILRPDSRRTSSDIQAFMEEARRVTRLNHPNIVEWKVFDETAEGIAYFVMELLAGEELEQAIQREGRIEPRRAARIALQVLDALRAAHDSRGDQPILHLDLKPQNVFLVERQGEEIAKVIDFGVGQFVAVPEGPPSAGGGAEAPNDGRCPTIRGPTRGLAVGGARKTTACTPEYASPEQCAHMLPDTDRLSLDGRSDVYSLGVIAFRMLTGEYPFPRPERRTDLLRMHLELAPRRAAAMGVRLPRSLARFVDRCLETDRERRWTAEEAYQALHHIVHPPAWISAAKLLGVLVSVASPLLWWLWPAPGRAPFDLFAWNADERHELVGGTLHTGPRRDQVRLEVARVPAEILASRVRLVVEPRPDAPDLGGFGVGWTEETRLILSASPRDRTFRSLVYLELGGDRGAPLYSAPFKLAYLAEDAWAIDSIELPAGGASAIDPEGQRLGVWLRCEPADIAAVHVLYGTNTFEPVRNSSIVRDGFALYELPIDALELPDGDQHLGIRVVDSADQERWHTQSIRVAGAPLTVESATLDVPRIDERWRVAPGRVPVLTLVLNRPADVAWTIMDSVGARLAGDTLAHLGRLEAPIDFPALKKGESYTGRIEVTADDRAYVAHAEDSPRGRTAVSLPFLYSDDVPAITVELLGTDNDVARVLDPATPFFVSERESLLAVLRESDVPVAVEVRPSDAAPAFLVDSQKRGERFPLALARDGLHDVSVRIWRYDGIDPTSGRPPDEVRHYSLVVDTVAPTLSIGGVPNDLVVDARMNGVILTAVVEDARSGDRAPPTPVDLEFRVHRKGSAEPIASGVLGRVLPPASVDFSLFEPWQSVHADDQRIPTDGEYVLTLLGRDLAFQTAAPALLEWTVARDGPVLEIERPDMLGDWVRHPESGRWEIAVRALDPNGTRAVLCTVSDRSDSRRAELVPLRRGDSDAGAASLWTGSLLFSHAWSGAAVDLRLTAEDSFGASTIGTATSRTLAPIARYAPTRIEVRMPSGVELERMRLVRGNAATPYVFGGRGDDLENRLFLASGLYDFNAKDTMKSWQVVYPPDAIADFYLDEQEVSVAQYLAFLRADDGWHTTDHWPDGTVGSEERLHELCARLGGIASTLPVSGVTWDEASAYARWAGKRLPSFVEWEYAVRGGADYRPFASFSAGVDPPSTDALNYDPLSARQHSAWPVDHGTDRVRGTTLLNLCGNVSEWTASPVFFIDRDAPRPAVDPAAYARANAIPLLDAERARACPEYWVAGGSYRSTRFDFSVAWPRRSSSCTPDVGFRCALGAASAVDRMDAASHHRRTIREVDE